MKNITLDSYIIDSEVIDTESFIDLDDKKKSEIKETKIVPPNSEHPFGAIKLIYKQPKYITHA